MDIADAIFVMSSKLTTTKAIWPLSMKTHINSISQFVALVKKLRFSGQKFVDSRSSLGMKRARFTGSLRGKMSPVLGIVM